jgi:hypothetical protein
VFPYVTLAARRVRSIPLLISSKHAATASSRVAAILVVLIGLILWTSKHCDTRFLDGDSCKIAGEQKRYRRLC